MLAAVKIDPAALCLSPLAAPRLLIVDDVEDNRTILARRFLKRGFECVEAVSGEAALEAIARETFDAVLLDVMMPGMSGLEVLRRARMRHSADELPIIMVTANAMSEDVAGALALGANDYVTKPVDFAVALARVNNQVERRRHEMEARGARERLSAENSGLASRVAESRARLERANAAVQAQIRLRLQSEDRIAYLAHHDVLTGLSNRFAFEQMVARLLASPGGGHGASLLFIDLDGFKAVNDTLGHAAGDDVLREVSARLHSIVGAEDICARLGGDEFAIFHVSENPQATAGALAARMIKALAGRYSVQGQLAFIGASIGVAVATTGAETPDELLKQADLAMYQAKNEGRGAYRYFAVEMRERAEQRRLLELDLRQAIEDKAFELHYQPFVDLQLRKVVGFEALLRWRRNGQAYVSPQEFIALAEENGLIGRIGEWALLHACQDAAHWPSDLRVAVNLSPAQFKSNDLREVVANALSVSGLDPARLELEITEFMLLRDNEAMREAFRQLRALGVKLSLDNFGAGYAGLGYFRSFRFDRVKIDRSFIGEMMQHPEARAIVQAAVGIGNSLGMATTAEGVENDDQLQDLMELGCGEAQGYLFSKPRPNADVLDVSKNVLAALKRMP
jgi:diguanylate cyclase (GGDEF)-like protein